MTITRLHCPQCEVSVEGRFTLGRLGLLSPEQLEFVEVYLRCGGKLKAVGELLKLSYPTVRSRLDEVIISLGYELPVIAAAAIGGTSLSGGEGTRRPTAPGRLSSPTAGRARSPLRAGAREDAGRAAFPYSYTYSYILS